MSRACELFAALLLTSGLQQLSTTAVTCLYAHFLFAELFAIHSLPDAGWYAAEGTRSEPPAGIKYATEYES